MSHNTERTCMFTYVEYACAVHYILCNCMTSVSRMLYNGNGDTIRITSCIRVRIYTHPGTYNVPNDLYNPAYTYMEGLLKPHEVYLHVSVYIHSTLRLI